MNTSGVEQVGEVEARTRWMIVDPPAPSSRVHRVGELLPAGFDAYLRLFHPFVPWSQVGPPVAASARRTWESLAGEAGIRFHAELTWPSLEPVLAPKDGGRRYAVASGTIEPASRARLFEALAGADDQDALFLFGLAAVILVRERLLYRASVSAIDSVCERAARDVGRQIAGPEIVWPKDRSWIVVSNYDLVSSYIAARADLASRLLAADELELLTVTRATRIDNRADLLNGTGDTPADEHANPRA